jgi:hypothetical protein
MKLFGKFHEMSINEIFLYNAPENEIADIIEKYPNTEIIVKEKANRPFYRKNGKDIYKIPGDPSCRHKIVLKQNLGYMKVEIHSYGLSGKQVQALGLKPIPATLKKEKAGQAILKLRSSRSKDIKVKKVGNKYVPVDWEES